MNFQVDFGAEDEVRLSPFKDDNPKDTENSTFEASSLLVVKAIQCIFDSFIKAGFLHFEVVFSYQFFYFLFHR